MIVVCTSHANKTQSLKNMHAEKRGKGFAVFKEQVLNLSEWKIQKSIFRPLCGFTFLGIERVENFAEFILYTLGNLQAYLLRKTTTFFVF